MNRYFLRESVCDPSLFGNNKKQKKRFSQKPKKLKGHLKNRVDSHIEFKDYNPNRLMILPPSLEELIDKNHPVRVVSQVFKTY